MPLHFLLGSMKSTARPHPSSPILLVLMLLVLVSFSSPGISAQEAEDEGEFSYEEGSEKGPENWGNLREEWRTCKTGRMQSPIDISSWRVTAILRTDIVQRNYTPANATIENRGHRISVQWELGTAGSITINGTTYLLHHLHWHTPSEHYINGRRYDMELHMVHVNPDPNVKNNTAVVGLLYKSGPPDDFISELEEDIRALTDQNGKRPIGEVDPGRLNMYGKNYYRYMGSLTTPPCREGVTWIINQKLATASRDQVELLRRANGGNNARPLQPLNRRPIYLHVPKV